MDYAEPEPNSSDNLYLMAYYSASELASPEQRPVGRYILNHDKRRYIGKDAVPANDRGDRVHPSSC